MKKIPIVEDDQLIGSAYKMRFQEPGYEVERAPDGFARINLVGAVKSEVVLLDRLMPRLDGIEVLNCRRRRRGGLPPGSPVKLAPSKHSSTTCSRSRSLSTPQRPER